MRAALDKSTLGLMLLLLLAATDARATVVAFSKIPPNAWGCTLCHGGAGATTEEVPLATADVQTYFGEQWRSLADAEIDRLWSEMAFENADRDGCSNGCELSDPYGSYLPGSQPPTTRCAEGNPNVGDCTIPLNEDTWSTLKSLFSEN